jgi:hypothetical protein
MSTELSRQVLDCLAVAKKLDRHDLALEFELHHSKWFAYRFLTPHKATEVFKEEYSKAYRLKYARNIDTEQAEKVTGFNSTDFTSTKQSTAFWRARQFADRLGVSYNVFCSAAFEVLLREGWKRIPYVNQLYGVKNEALIAGAVKKHWAEYRDAWFRFSDLLQYREEHFRYLPAQIAHREYVVKEISRRPGWLNTCFDKKLLPVDLAIDLFGVEYIERWCGSVPVNRSAPSETIAESEFHPSCHSIPGAYHDATPTCSSCPFRQSCLSGVQMVEDKLKAKYGTLDPKADHRKECIRIRVANHRAKKKAATGPTLMAFAVSAFPSRFAATARM